MPDLRQASTGSVHARRRHASPVALTGKEVEALIDQTFDSVDDVALHVRRLVFGGSDPSTTDFQTPDDPRPRVVVLGTGWAAHAMVKTIDTDKYRVLVVSPRNYFMFTPMLAATCVGTVEYRSITEPIRSSNPLVGYLEGECVAIDLGAQTISVSKPNRNGGGGGGSSSNGNGVGGKSYTLPYDTLVFACGVQSSTFGVPGVAEHCKFVKEIEDAREIRRAVGDAFESACAPGVEIEEIKRLLTFVTVGAGPTGVEFTGELMDFIKEISKKFYPRLAPYTRVVLVQSGPDLLPGFDDLLKASAKKSLEKRGVNVEVNARVTAVTATHATIQRKGQEDEELPCGLCVWAGGTRPRPITESVIKQLGPEAAAATEKATRFEKGKIPVDAWLRVVGAPLGTVIAMGDAAFVADAEEPLPQTAQVAAQQGAFVSRLLNREYDLATNDPGPIHPNYRDPLQAVKLRGATKAPPFTFVNLGKLAYVGGGEALSQIELGSQRLLTEAGSVGFLLWRSVYLVKQVAFRNRVLVLFDWMKSQAFGRDTTRF